MTRRGALFVLLALVAGCAALRGGSPHQETDASDVIVAAPPSESRPTEEPAPDARELVPGVVASEHPLATEAGAAVLRDGGTAFDAAVTVALVLGVTNPHSSGIGGGGFAVFKAADGPVRSLDFRETAPSFFTATTFSEDEARSSSRGPWSTGVPGEIAGLGWLHETGGVLPWSRLVEPARAIAADGFPVGSSLAKALTAMQERVLADPGMRAAFAPDGVVLKEGEACRRPALARTLEYVQLHGPDGFYRGPIATSLAGFLAGQGVPWTADELAAYRVVEREPLRGGYRDWTVFSMGPPSSGGIALLQTLGQLERREHQAMEYGSVEWTRTLAQALTHSFADRATYGGDPDHVTVPVADLLAAPTIDALVQRSPATGPVGMKEAGMAGLRGDIEAVVPDDGGTSHLSVLDGLGNAVALTTTINLWFGSGQIDPGTGVVLNDEMDDFAARPGVPNAFGLVQSENSAPGAGRRPLSSMTPTLATDAEGRVVLAVGGAGGPRIITGTMQTLLGVLDRGLSAKDAVSAPRIHHQWFPGTVFFEEGFAAEVKDALAAEGFAVDGPTSARVDVVTFDPATGTFDGSSDTRDGGSSVVVSP